MLQYSKLVDKYEANNAEVVIGGGDDSTKTASTKKRSTRSQTPQSAAIVTTEKREFRRTPARLNRLNEAGVSVQHTPSKLSNLVASSTTVTTRSGRKNVVEGGETVAPIGKTASTRTPRSRNSSTNSNMDEVVSSSSASSTPHSSRRGGKLSSSRGKLLDEQQTSLSSTPKSVVRRSVSQSIATSKSTTRAQKE